jgi:DNA polymerase III gamma/tau subunit
MNDGNSPVQFLSDFIEFLRGCLLLHFDTNVCQQETGWNIDTINEIKSLLSLLPVPKLLFMIEKAMHRYEDARHALIAQLPLELFAVECSKRYDDSEHPTKESTASTPTTVPPTAVPPTAVTPTQPTSSPKNEPSSEHQPPKSNPPQETRQVAPAIVADKIPEPTTTSHDHKSIDKSAVEKIWPTLMSTLETKNPSLVFLLKMATVKEVSQNTVTLVVQYTFHADKLTEAATKRNLENQLAELLH